MNRIEEIKERLHNFKTAPSLEQVEQLLTDDLVYLLSINERYKERLEIAEKALEEAIASMEGLDMNVFMERADEMDEYEEGEYITKAIEALKAIRE